MRADVDEKTTDTEEMIARRFLNRIMSQGTEPDEESDEAKEAWCHHHHWNKDEAKEAWCWNRIMSQGTDEAKEAWCHHHWNENRIMSEGTDEAKEAWCHHHWKKFYAA